jgi:hypothetical protein
LANKTAASSFCASFEAAEALAEASALKPKESSAPDVAVEYEEKPSSISDNLSKSKPSLASSAVPYNMAFKAFLARTESSLNKRRARYG